MTFDPNKQTDSTKRKLNYDYLWATYIPSRSPKFKIHGNRGQATNAVKYRSHWQRGDTYAIDEEVKLYHRDTVDGLWVEVPIKYIHSRGEDIIL